MPEMNLEQQFETVLGRTDLISHLARDILSILDLQFLQYEAFTQGTSDETRQTEEELEQKINSVYAQWSQSVPGFNEGMFWRILRESMTAIGGGGFHHRQRALHFLSNRSAA